MTLTDEPWKEVSMDCSLFDRDMLESYAETLAWWQRGINWWIGDIAIEAESRYPDSWQQAFPEWMSPGLINRSKAVAKAYTPDSRNRLATWSQHQQVANKPDRIALVAAMVEKGETTDQSRESAKEGPRWLLAVDVNYFLHRFWHSGAGVESAMSVAGWVQRTAERLREKGLTDVLCCFDSQTNFRKKLTAEWEDKYKDRPPKDPELSQQLTLVRQLLQGHGFACSSVDGYEADDVMASAAKQFPGRTTLFTQDKDLRQCLSDRVNMLRDVEWIQEVNSGDLLPIFEWLSAKQHTELTGIAPAQWPDFQAIMGDACDGIKGAHGIGEKGAADLIKAFGSVEKVIAAVQSGDERIKPRQREALSEFESRLGVTRRHVTLRTDLDVPKNTRLT